MPCLPERHHADDQSSQASQRNYALYGDRSHTPRRAILHRESRTFAHRFAAVTRTRSWQSAASTSMRISVIVKYLTNFFSRAALFLRIIRIDPAL